jgi:hypothetical protein
MDSRTVLAFRIFVMLCCLIIVPMAAIFGSAFPEVVKGLLVDRIVYWATGKAPQVNREADPHGFGSVAPAASETAPAGATPPSDAPRWSNPSEATSWQSNPPVEVSGAVMPAAAAVVDPGGDQPAAYVEPIPSERAATGGDSVYAAGRGQVGATIGPAGSHAESRPAEPGGTSDPALAQPDPFTAMERKLREYGATYYLLETWGNESELFRFHCKMAIGNNPNYTRHFEATDRDALRAMKRVLERVEAWRAGRP